MGYIGCAEVRSASFGKYDANDAPPIVGTSYGTGNGATSGLVFVLVGLRFFATEARRGIHRVPRTAYRVRWGEERTPTFLSTRYSSITHTLQSSLVVLTFCVISLLVGVRTSPQLTIFIILKPLHQTIAVLF